VNPNFVGETLATLTARRSELQLLRATLAEDLDGPLGQHIARRLAQITPEIERLRDSYWREAERPIRRLRKKPHPRAGG